MKKVYFIIPIIIISLLTIGFSAFENSLLVDDIAVEVRVKKDIRVTEITSATGNNGGVVGTYDYNVNNINGTITLPNSNSSVTYIVKVTNIGNTDMGILRVIDLPSNLDYEITDYTEGEKLCNGSNVCSGGIDKTFNITIKYKDETTTNEPMDFIATFDFRGFHNINYNNSVVGEVIDGGNKVVNLGNNAPDEITITGTYINQSYTKPNLTLEGVTTDITISDVVDEQLPAYNTLINIYDKSIASEDSSCDNSLLYDDTADQNLRFVGSKPCNYIYFNKTNWRIIGIFTINNEKLIKIINPTVYGDSIKFNDTNTIGNQKWPNCTLSNTLNGTFYQQIVSNGYSDYVKDIEWNIGSPSAVTTPKGFYDAEILVKSASAVPVGLLNISDIGYATSGPANGDRVTKCLNVSMNSWTAANCISNSINNWLYLGDIEFTIDAVSDRAFVYRMQNNAKPYQGNINKGEAVRTVVYLKENVKFKEGNGSSNAPYILD